MTIDIANLQALSARGRNHPAPTFAAGAWCIQAGCLLTIAKVERSAGPLLWLYCVRCQREDGSTGYAQAYQFQLLADVDGVFAGLRPRPIVRDRQR